MPDEREQGHYTFVNYIPPSEWSPTIGRTEDNVKDKSSSGIHLCDTIGQPKAANSGNEIKTTPWVNPFANYETLQSILDDAFCHAATGKGKERHARDLPFDDQPIMQTTRLVGPGFPLGQAIKKAGEAAGMIERGELSAAEAECLGAINYLAGAVAWMREQATMRGKEAA
jgi:hypothetical protein